MRKQTNLNKSKQIERRNKGNMLEKVSISSQINFGISRFLVCYNKYVIVYDTFILIENALVLNLY